VTSSVGVFETVIWVKWMHVIKSCLKPRKNKYGNKRNRYINLPLKDRLDIQGGPKK